MSDVYGDSPAVERPDPFVAPDAADAVSLDSEIDYDDEQDDDQLPLDVVEAIEAGVLLDDPETLDDDGLGRRRLTAERSGAGAERPAAWTCARHPGHVRRRARCRGPRSPARPRRSTPKPTGCALFPAPA